MESLPRYWRSGHLTVAHELAAGSAPCTRHRVPASIPAGVRGKHYLDQGVSKAELSRRFGISRRTIHSWIESGQLDRDLSSGESSYAP